MVGGVIAVSPDPHGASRMSKKEGNMVRSRAGSGAAVLLGQSLRAPSAVIRFPLR
jgi:hypothetical protein